MGTFIIGCIGIVILAFFLIRRIALTWAYAPTSEDVAAVPAVELLPEAVDDREITGDFVPIAECHCKLAHSKSGKRIERRKQPKLKKRGTTDGNDVAQGN